MSGKHIFSVNVDFSQRELLNAVLQNLFQAPLVPIEGQVYYDSFYNVPHYWNDNEWIPWERPVHKKYLNQSAMIADQQYQLKQFIYFDGTSYWEYLGTTNGNISDYREFGSSYVHPTYTPYDLTLTGATVIQDFETDTIGSVVNVTTRELTPQDIGAEPVFPKGDIIISIDSGLSYTGTTEDRLVGSGNLTIINNDKGSDQNIFKEIKNLSGNTVISATTNNDFIQIEGQSGTTVSFQSGNRVIISSPEQDNFVRVLNVPCDFVDFNLPLKPQIVNYINQLDPPLIIKDNESKYNVVINCEQSGTTVSCDNGIDALFVLDYTASMGSVIQNIKNSITSITQKIVEISGGNYRLALVIFDEYSTGQAIQPNYSNSTFYNELLSNGQVYINTGTSDKQYITLVTDFSTANINEFETNFLKIYTGTTNTSNNFPLGFGSGSAEPYDMALDVCINGVPFTGTTRTEFLTPFRTNVNKQIILITDDLPSGTNDDYNIIDVNFINGVLKNDILSKNIKLSMLSVYYQNSLPTNPNTNQDRFLQTFIFNGFNRTFTLNNHAFGLLNIQINNNTTRLNINEYSINFINKTITIADTVSLINGDEIKIIYQSNAILNIVSESNGIYVKSYSPDTIKETIEVGCGNTLPPTTIYQISGVGLGNTELLSCLNYSPTQNVYTFCNTINIGCELYYDDEGSIPITNYDFISINDNVYELSNFGEIIALSSFNCNNIITTYLHTGIGYANTSQNACDDAGVNNRSIYSNCENITNGCNIYIDQYGLVPLTGYSKIFIDSQVWDINSSTGSLIGISSTQCSSPVTIYTHTNCGYANTSQNACDDAVANNRTLYSDCSLITSGCTIYTNIAGTIPLTGYTRVFIDNKVWDLNSITGDVILFSSTQCAGPSLTSFTSCGYGNTVSTACNDAIINNRTVYSDCSTISVGCEIYIDFDGNSPLTGYNYISIDGNVWELNLGSTIISLSPIQC